VIERTDENYSAYVPDLPGGVATAIDGLAEDGLPVSSPSGIAE
jgi:hypothetical protein